MTKNTPTVKIIVATHKKYEMPQDAMYLPLHVGAEGKTDQNGNPLDLGYQKDNTGENISNKNAAYCELTGLPSHFEGLPIVGVEAQASGLPVILSDQIDRSAKLTDSVEFLDIKLNTAAKWVDVILKFRKRTDDRKCAYYFLKKEKFSIKDTVNEFLELYK